MADEPTAELPVAAGEPWWVPAAVWVWHNWAGALGAALVLAAGCWWLVIRGR